MLPIQLRSTADTKITVTSTATNLFDLIDTANTKGSRKYYNDLFANAIIINPEDGDIRFLEGNDPTATEGILISQGTKEYIPGITLDQIQLIRTGSSDVAVTVVPYRSEPGESPGAIAYDVTLEAGDIQIGAVEIKNATTDDRATVDTNGNLSVRNFSQLVPEEYDYIALTYVAAGNGAGEIETVTYKEGGSGGTTVATLTLTYDGSNNLSDVTKS